MDKKYKMATPPEGWEWVFCQGSRRGFDTFRLVTTVTSEYEEFAYFYPSLVFIGWDPRLIAKESRKIVRKLRRRLRTEREYPPDVDGYTFVPYKVERRAT